MHNEVRRGLAGLFALLLCWGVLGLATPAAAAGNSGGGQVCRQSLLPDQLKVLAKTVAAASTALGNISGRVTDKSTAAGIAGVSVTAVPLGSGICSSSGGGSAVTDVNGNYTIPGLTGGSYRVHFTYISFVPLPGTPNYIPQWYNGVLDESQGTIVQVTDPGTTPNINAALDPGGSISGTVSSATGPLSGILVTVTGTKGVDGFATTGPTGAYTVTSLASDSYSVSFSSSAITGQTQYIRQDYPGKVPVTAPNNTPNINIVLQPGGSIIGLVTDAGGIPLSGVSVSALQSGSLLPSGFGVTDQTGAFTVGGLASGTYDVTINGRSVFTFDFTTGTLLVKGYILVKKTGVSVTAPDSTNIGTIPLQPGGQIKGTVRNPTGAPLENIAVSAYDASGFVNVTLTQADGTYTITGLDTGAYKVQFSACQGVFVEQWYNNKPDQATADPVSVTAPNTVTGIDATLNLAAANTPPVAAAQSLTTAQNTAKAITLAATDVNNDPLTYLIVSQPAHGTLSGAAPNLTYTPASGYSGPDSFTFKANDGQADSNVATVSLTVTPAGTSLPSADVNGNGKVDVFDALLTLQYALNLIPHNPANDALYLANADVAPLDANQKPKGDGKIDVFDALVILQRAVNLLSW